MALVSIGNYNFPTPSTYNATTSTIVDSARNVEGKMVGTVVRNDVAKVEITYRYLSAEKWAEVLSKFSPALGGSFINNVRFLDQTRNDFINRNLYVSDRTASGFKIDEAPGKLIGYTDIRLALIEV